MKIDLSQHSCTEYQSVNAPVNTSFSFDRKDQEPEMQMTVTGRDRVTYRKVQKAAIDENQFLLYIGAYYCDELQVTYRIAIKDGRLVFLHRHAPKIAFEPIGGDEFRVGIWIIKFEHDNENHMSGFTRYAERLRMIKFIRMD